MSAPRVLIICKDYLNRSPRVMMEVNALHQHYKLFAAGYSDGSSMSDRFEFIDMKNAFKKRFVFHYKWPTLLRKLMTLMLFIPIKIYSKYGNKNIVDLNEEYNLLKNIDPKLIIIHHPNGLELGYKLSRLNNAKLIFNAHEYYPLEFEDNPEWVKKIQPYNIGQCKKYFPYLNGFWCVCQTILDKYKNEFYVNGIVVENSKRYYDLQPINNSNQPKFNMIHHGGAIRSRKIEMMIEMMKILGSNYQLDLMLVESDSGYIKELKDKAKNVDNIRFIEAVAIDEIPNYTNKYDIGLFLLPPTNYNYASALPNKFFEFIQARLAIAIGPSPEMKRLVEQYNLGVVSEEFTAKSLAKSISQLSKENVWEYKLNCHAAAQKLNSHQTEETILNNVNQLIGCAA